MSPVFLMMFDEKFPIAEVRSSSVPGCVVFA